MCGTQELLPKINPERLYGDRSEEGSCPSSQLGLTGWTRERGNDPAGAPTAFGLITHVKSAKSGNGLPAHSLTVIVEEPLRWLQDAELTTLFPETHEWIIEI